MSEEPKELTLFEKIANHTLPSDMVYEDDLVCVLPHPNLPVLCLQGYQPLRPCSYHRRPEVLRWSDSIALCRVHSLPTDVDA